MEYMYIYIYVDKIVANIPYMDAMENHMKHQKELE